MHIETWKNMDSRPANKKLRLSSGSSRNNSNNPGQTSKSKYSAHDDFDLWGDDLAVDDDLIQKIETQGYSQYQNNDLQPSGFHCANSSQVDVVNSTQPPRIDDAVSNLQFELQSKSGEVKNLRMEMENKAKEFRHQLSEKDALIEDLKRQLSGKQSEIEFQKIEQFSQSCKTPKATTSKTNKFLKPVLKPSPNLNSSFRERFSFSANRDSVKDTTVFSFSRPLHKGDILYKLLQPTVTFRNTKLNEDCCNTIVAFKEKYLPENEFAVYLETYLLQLCRFCSFDSKDAQDLLKLVLKRSHELLLRFHKELSRKEVKTDICSRKPRVIILPKSKNPSEFKEEECLLSNTKLTAVERGVQARQTITMLSKLLEVEPNSAKMLIEPDRAIIASCTCSISEKVMNVNNLFNSSLKLSSPEKMDTDDNSRSLRKLLVFDVVELIHDIVQEITVREKSSKYEGVFSSILHFYSVLCSCANIYEKQYELIILSVKKILFSLPGFFVVQYVIEFLNSSAQLNFFDSLCCRSAAETFTENFKCFSFTKETCMLQVICACVEMVNKTPKFIFNFISWICSLTSTSHNVKWLSNKTDSKYCECLLMLEQITIKIVLNCVNQHNSSSVTTDKMRSKSLLRRCANIFQQFRWRDTDFDLHISTCRGEYRMLLQSLQDIVDDDVTKRFVTQELEATNPSQKNDLPPEMKDEIIHSMLKVFTEDNL